MLVKVPPGKRKRVRPQRRYMDNIIEDMREFGAKETGRGEAESQRRRSIAKAKK